MTMLLILFLNTELPSLKLEESRFQLELNDFYLYCNDLTTLQDGRIVGLFEESGSRGFSLVLFDKEGNTLKSISSKGSGPGEFHMVDTLSSHANRIYVPETLTPIIHEFDSDLLFVRDYRSERGGFIHLNDDDYFGIWGKHPTSRGVDMLGLYPKPKSTSRAVNLKVEKTLIPFENEPKFVARKGGFCKISDNLYAGILVNEFNPYLFNGKFEAIGNLFRRSPSHILPYTPWKGQSNKISTSDAKNWLQSWTQVESIHHMDGKIIICYTQEGTRFIDIADLDGNFLAKKQPLTNRIQHTDNDHIWCVESKEDVNTGDQVFTIVKIKIILKK